MSQQAKQLERALSGDPDAFQQLLSRHRPRLGLYARRQMHRQVRRRVDASDIVQMACLEAYRSFRHFRGSSDDELRAWLETIVRRQLAGQYQHHTRQRRDIRREFAPSARANALDSVSGHSIIWNRLPASGPGPRSAVIRGESAILLADALRRLPDDQRCVVEMRFMANMKLREIAQRTHSSVGRVAGLLRRGVENLNRLLPAEVHEKLEGSNR